MTKILDGLIPQYTVYGLRNPLAPRQKTVISTSTPEYILTFSFLHSSTTPLTRPASPINRPLVVVRLCTLLGPFAPPFPFSPSDAIENGGKVRLLVCVCRARRESKTIIRSIHPTPPASSSATTPLFIFFFMCDSSRFLFLFLLSSFVFFFFSFFILIFTRRRRFFSPCSHTLWMGF